MIYDLTIYHLPFVTTASRSAIRGLLPLLAGASADGLLPLTAEAAADSLLPLTACCRCWL